MKENLINAYRTLAVLWAAAGVLALRLAIGGAGVPAVVAMAAAGGITAALYRLEGRVGTWEAGRTRRWAWGSLILFTVLALPSRLPELVGYFWGWWSANATMALAVLGLKARRNGWPMFVVWSRVHTALFVPLVGLALTEGALLGFGLAEPRLVAANAAVGAWVDISRIVAVFAPLWVAGWEAWSKALVAVGWTNQTVATILVAIIMLYTPAVLTWESLLLARRG